jgi:phosphoglycolate phosphatase
VSNWPSDPAALLFDLDGTLVDPEPGIVGSVRHALNAMGREIEPDLDLTWVIGPPLRQSFGALLAGQGDPEVALGLYRERYGTIGLTEAEVYPGIPQALEALGRPPTRLIVCTSKPRVFAVRVLEHFGLARHFSAVYGAELDGRFDDKAELIAHLLEAERLSADRVLMIGDRKYDVVGAARNGVAAIGVLWGHGDEAELRAAGAGRLCRQPEALAAACLGPFAESAQS